MKFELRYESFKSKFTSVLFAYNLVSGHSKKNRENYPRERFDKKRNKPRLKLTTVPGLLLTGVGTTEPWEIRDKVK